MGIFETEAVYGVLQDKVVRLHQLTQNLLKQTLQTTLTLGSGTAGTRRLSYRTLICQAKTTSLIWSVEEDEKSIE